MPRFAPLLLILLLVASGCAGRAGESAEVRRGRELILKAGCNDCHTEGYLAAGGVVPEGQWLAGSRLGFRGPWGVQYPTNLRLLLSRLDEAQWLAVAAKMRTNSPMAWSLLPTLERDDLRDMYAFVRWLGPLGEPAPASLPPGVAPTTEVIDFPRAH